jgi:hypothetical protein
MYRLLDERLARARFLPAAMVVVAACLAFSNSFAGVFVSPVRRNREIVAEALRNAPPP